VQNADDNNYSAGVEPTLVFILQSNGIVVLNNERGFSDKNIRALCDVGNSTKKGLSSGYIGKKGIGFKSVFRVSVLFLAVIFDLSFFSEVYICWKALSWSKEFSVLFESSTLLVMCVGLLRVLPFLNIIMRRCYGRTMDSPKNLFITLPWRLRLL
jgi:hypothetical protein